MLKNRESVGMKQITLLLKIAHQLPSTLRINLRRFSSYKLIQIIRHPVSFPSRIVNYEHGFFEKCSNLDCWLTISQLPQPESYMYCLKMKAN